MATKLLDAERIADGVLKELVRNMGEKGMRQQAKKGKGQFYVFDGGNLKKTFAQMKTIKIKGEKRKDIPVFDDKNLNVSQLIKDIDVIWLAVEKQAFSIIGKDAFDKKKKQKPRIKRIAKVNKTGAKVYIVKDYNEVSRVNLSKVNPLIIKRMKESLKEDTKALKRLKAAPISAILSGNQGGQTGIETLDGKTAQKNLGTQLGHGEHGKSVAAMQAEALGSWAKANRHSMPEGQYEQIQDALITVESVLDCTLNYTNVKDGELSVDADLIISNQMTMENSQDAQAMEQPIAAWLMTYLTGQMVKGQGFGHWASAVVEKKVLLELFKGWKFKKSEVFTEKTIPELSKLDTSAQRKKKKSQVRQHIAYATGWGAAGLTREIIKSTKEAQYSKLGVKTGQKGTPGKEDRRMAQEIMTKAQNALHKKVKERMEYPSLQYRSGRFAESVKLMNLTQTAKGLKAQYKYDMEHYGTFEPGNKQGNRARDPNSLIEEAITRATHSVSGVIPRLFQKLG